MEWNDIFKEPENLSLLKEIESFLTKERKSKCIYPAKENVFKAFELTPFNKVKVVIIGQDPYHGLNQADGLAFSTNDSKTPKSLQNIKKELKNDLNIEISSNNKLDKWAKNGVLLLNTILTVESGKPLSHQKIGWEKLTLNIILKLSSIRNKLVFVLWGNNARSYKKYIKNIHNHFIIESAHPSPLSASRGFFGSKPFSKTNDFLISQGLQQIDFNF